MKAVLMMFGAVVLCAAIGCDDKKPTTPADKGKDIDVKAGPVDVKVNDGEVKVNAPNADVEVEKK